MKNALIKDTLREIKRAPGRFLSVFLIVALGCGFFSGIKATMPDMVGTAAKYFEEFRLMDMRFISTIGVRSSDVEAVKEADNVRGAHAAYSKDVFYLHDDQTLVLKCISFNSTLDDDSPNLMNKINVIEGRMPVAPGECAVEVKISSPDTFRLGEMLTFTDPDDTKRLTDTLENDTFKIVGIVTSPLYIGYERDPTDVGSGTIVSNVFLREEEFITNYYTEMFVDLEGLDEKDPFSEDYRKSVEVQGAAAEKAFRESVMQRYEKLKGDADEKIAAAEATAETLEKIIDMPQDELKSTYIEYRRKAEAAKQVYEDEQAKGRNALLERSAMLKTEKALKAVGELILDGDDENGKAHTEYRAQLEQAYKDINDAREQTGSVGEPEFYCYDRFKASKDYSSFEGDSRKIDSISRVFPVFFVLVAALVCLTTMSRIVEEQRSTIGVYKALGYTEGEILSRYMLYSAAAAVSGSVIGSAVGMKIFPHMIYSGYKMLYNIPKLSAPIHPLYMLMCCMVSVICVCGVTVFSCRRELAEHPGSLMRPRSPVAGKRVFLERIGPVWNRLSFMGKVTTRNMLRSKRRAFMTLAGVAGCTALIITGFGLKNSIGSVIDKQFGQIYLYDGMAVLNRRCGYDDIEAALSGREEIEAYSQAVLNEITAHTDKGQYTADICVFDRPEKLESFIVLSDAENGSRLTLDESGVIITEKLAKLLALHEGDDLELTDSEGKTVSVKVTGISENYALHYVFMLPGTYEEKFGEKAQNNVAFIDLKKGCEREAFRQELINDERFYGLSYQEDQSSGVKNNLDSMDAVIAVLIVSAGLLAVVVLYDLASINITERKREIATVKVLGFFDRETDDYILRENLLSACAGLLLGLPLGRVLHYFVTVTAEVDMMMFDRTLDGMSCLWGVLMTAGFTLAVNIGLHFALRKIDMISSLKSVE